MTALYIAGHFPRNHSGDIIGHDSAEKDIMLSERIVLNEQYYICRRERKGS